MWKMRNDVTKGNHVTCPFLHLTSHSDYTTTRIQMTFCFWYRWQIQLQIEFVQIPVQIISWTLLFWHLIPHFLHFCKGMQNVCCTDVGIPTIRGTVMQPSIFPFSFPLIIWIPRLISWASGRAPAVLHKWKTLSLPLRPVVCEGLHPDVCGSAIPLLSLRPLQSLCQWVLSVKKNYRKHVAYHNWRHAFNTAQSMFALLKSGRFQVSSAHCWFLLKPCSSTSQTVPWFILR